MDVHEQLAFPAAPFAIMLARTTMDKLTLMRKAPLFSALGDAQMRQLLAECQPKSLAAGAMVFGPMQKAERFYLVLWGHVKIYMVSPRGDEQILHLYGPGETFGEAAMWADICYPAYAQTLEETHVLSISKASLRRAIAAHPELAFGMMAGLSAKLREFSRLIEDLSLKEVPARLAGVLVAAMKKSGSKRIILKQTKRQLASQIGTIAETLSRALAKMKADGLIAVDGNTIDILDAEALEEAAENG